MLASPTDMDDLTPRQQRIVEYIRRTVQDRGYPPTVREIGEAVGLTSSSSVHAQLANLQRKGLLRKDPAKPRAIEVAGARPQGAGAVTVPVLGRIAAGAPVLAEEHIEDHVAIDAALAGEEEHFALRVAGDSMIDAGILDGDLVVIRRQDNANTGDIIVALIDDEEATLKRFRRRGSSIALEAANQAYETRVLGPDRVKIQGKLVSLVRRY
jgi:repressor LexA